MKFVFVLIIGIYGDVIAAHSSLDGFVAHWFGLNQSKYQWALDDYYESKGGAVSIFVLYISLFVCLVGLLMENIIIRSCCSRFYIEFSNGFVFLKWFDILFFIPKTTNNGINLSNLELWYGLWYILLWYFWFSCKCSVLFLKKSFIYVTDYYYWCSDW